MRGDMAEALPLFDRALEVTVFDPALTDLRLLLQLNKAVTLGSLDRHEEALAAAGQARQLADQAGRDYRLVKANQRAWRAAVPDRALGRRASPGGRPTWGPDRTRRGLL